MSWQTSGGTGDSQADDDTRTAWAGSGGTQEPTPTAPPPPPGPADAHPVPTAGPEPAGPPAPPPAPPAVPVAPGYGAPQGPAAPPPGYGAPQPGYGTPQPGYGTPQPGYGTPQPGYGAPQGAPVPWAPPTTVSAPAGLAVPGAPGLVFGGVLHRFLAYMIDSILVAIGAGILAGIVGAAAGGSSLTAWITAVVFMGSEFLYFVGLWTGANRATLGMRVMKLQIGNAFDGRTLSMQQAVIRWVALGLPFQAFGSVPALVGISGLAGLWTIVLLISTAVSPTRQGIHDKLANSAIVQPIGASTPAVACLVLVLIAVGLIVVLPIVALILLGGQMSQILSEVGASI